MTGLLLNDNTIKGQGLRVSGSLLIDTEELGAQTSTTARAQKGFKPKKLTVTLQIRYDNEKDLTRLMALAESVDSNGKATVYDIINKTANAMKVRQVTFIDNVRVNEVEGKDAWTISFMLAEYLSIPEKKEQRQPAANATQQTADGSVPVAQTTAPEPTAQPLTGFEEFLQGIEERIS